VQNGHAVPQRAGERGLSDMDSAGGYAAVIVVLALVLVASMFV
jgi:hypothetical protein